MIDQNHLPKKNITAALVQDAPYLYDLPRTLEAVKNHCLDLKQSAVDLVVFPEAFLGGYPKGDDFSVKMGYRIPQSRDSYLAYWQASIQIGDDATAFLASLAKQCQFYLMMGCIEKHHGTLYCSTLLFSPDGELIHHHRKLIPTAMERVVWGQGDGSTMTVASAPIGRIGSAICWENYMPLYRQHLYNQHIQLYCAPTVDDRDSWLATVRHIAMEGRCFVLSCCQFMTRDHLTTGETVKTALDKHILIRGGSCIVGPLGDFIVEPVYDQTAVLFASLDLNDLIKAKFDMDVSGHYARPDVFTLQVND
jgi:nitrilase